MVDLVIFFSLRARRSPKHFEETTYDFLLVIYSNHRPVSHRFREKRRFLSKMQIFLFRVRNCPAAGSPWYFVTSEELKKLE